MQIARTRIIAYYVVLAAFTAAAAAVAFSLGSSRHSEPNVAGVWAFANGHPDPCLGPAFVLQQSGSFATIRPPGNAGPSSQLRVSSGLIHGTVGCLSGGQRAFTGRVSGPPRTLRMTIGGRAAVASDTGQAVPAAGQKLLPPTSLSGTYTNVPPSVCLSSTVLLKALGGQRYTVVVGPLKDRRRLRSTRRPAPSPGRCDARAPGRRR